MKKCTDFERGIFLAGIITQRLHDCPEIVADVWLDVGLDPTLDYGIDLCEEDMEALEQIKRGRKELEDFCERAEQ